MTPKNRDSSSTDSESTPASESPQTLEGQGIRVEVARDSAVVRTLSIEVEASEVRKAYDRTYRDLSRTARIPGFRPGKTPRSVLEKRYGASVAEEIERLLVSQTLGDAIELAGLRPVAEPEVDADSPAPDTPFTYRVRIEVKPEIQLPELAGLRGRRPAVEVPEDQVQSELENLRLRQAPLLEEPEEMEAALGHFLLVDFVGRVDGEPFDGGRGQGVEVELGAGRLVPGFEEQLVGARAGEDREVRVTFPDDYAESTLRGREAEFAVHVVAVRRRELAELDDDFAKDLDEEFESLEELRDRVRSDLVAERERAARATLERSVMDSLIAQTDFEVPPAVVERQLQSQLESMRQQFQGRVPPDQLQAQLSRMREDGRSSAERRVREALLLESVVASEGLSVTSEDVDARLDEMAAQQQVEPSKLRAMADEQGWRDALESELLDQRALDFLTAGATVEETTDGETSQ